ncbi:MAG: ATP-dependent Clp protease proteolytic subunit [Patescibacteria group bacterium]|nr:ATP-dependent Clp protease proteolytic subunit [Patescibacteria group bacterium]MDE2014912.1 ATP-dependent Clp protease proteolytic subunit [Patescibacteria group bacterium]MDE2226341.1 ATP-dependent Clp protease proteolytic subunit [Patescibacteria group bacterium]
MPNNKRKKLYSDRSPLGIKVSEALLGDFIPEDVHVYRIDRHTFTIYVGGESISLENQNSDNVGEPGVEYNMADRFEINLGTLSGIDSERPILVSLASCGGGWEPGMQMFGAILSCPNPITIMATKWARSMTSLIPLAADKFIIRPPAKYMFHYGTYGFRGLAQEAETDFIELVRSREIMLNIYTARLKEQGKFSRWSRLRIREMLKRHLERKIDMWLDANEAKCWGFADEVFDGNYDNLRATQRNDQRRKSMFKVLSSPIDVKVNIEHPAAPQTLVV